MSTAIPAGVAFASRRPPSMASNTLCIARRELRDALKSRWFVLYTLAFVVLGLAVSFVSAAGTGGTGFSGFGRTTAGLVNLILLVVPLMALTAGAATIASDRERGMLAYLLSQPVSPVEVLLGKYIGLGTSLLAAISLGLGACAVILSWRGGVSSPQAILWLAGLSFVLALGMLSVGIMISSLTRRASAAVGVAIFVWLTLVFVSDLALMAGAVALHLRIDELFALSLLNPLQVFKMWSLHAVDANLDVLGPAGLYAVEEYGRSLHAIFAAGLSAWIVLPLVAASVVLARKSPL